MPEDLTSQGASSPAASGASGASPAPAPSSPAPGQANLSSGTTPAPAASPAGAAQPGAGSSTPGQSAPDASQYATVREALREMGLDLGGQFQDDHSLLQHMAGVYRERAQLSQLAQAGQVYLQHQDRFQAWMREQQEQEQRKQAQAQQWWKAPEYDPSWASKLTRDPATGEIKALPGADPGVVQKYLAWMEHQRTFQEKFSQDPIKAIQPGLEQLIDQRAQQLISQQMGGYQERVQAQQLVQEHAGWIHARDQEGNVLRGPNGQPQLSEWGQRYAGYVQQSEQLGLRSTESQHKYALALVQRDFLASKLGAQSQQQQAQAQGDAAKAQFLEQAGGTHQPNVGSQHAGGVNGAPQNAPAINGQRALADLMLKNMVAGGFQPGQLLNTR